MSRETSHKPRVAAAPRGAAVLASIAVAALVAASRVWAAEPTTQLPRTVRPTHYDLTIVPDAAALTFRGEATIAIEVLQPSASITLPRSRCHSAH